MQFNSIEHSCHWLKSPLREKNRQLVNFFRISNSINVEHSIVYQLQMQAICNKGKCHTTYLVYNTNGLLEAGPSNSCSPVDYATTEMSQRVSCGDANKQNSYVLEPKR